jgi:hypothetical protein
MASRRRSATDYFGFTASPSRTGLRAPRSAGPIPPERISGAYPRRRSSASPGAFDLQTARTGAPAGSRATGFPGVPPGDRRLAR